jgi:hypothetical protein
MIGIIDFCQKFFFRLPHVHFHFMIGIIDLCHKFFFRLPHVLIYLVNEALLVNSFFLFFKGFFLTPDNEESREPILIIEKPFRQYFFNIIDSMELFAVLYFCLLRHAFIKGVTDNGNKEIHEYYVSK